MPPFFPLDKAMLKSPEWASLTSHTVKLIVDLGVQYQGNNNGDLCAAWSVMRPRGWRSPATLNRSLKDAKGKGFVEVSRQGGRNKCSLYALTFFPVNECGGKLDIKHAITATHAWRKNSLPSL